MMTDINIWNSSLGPDLVTSWMRCSQDADLGGSLLVDWNTADWMMFGVSVERLAREEVCYREREERLYMFSVGRKDFYQSADFCHLLGGKLGRPRSRKELQALHMNCSGFTGWNDREVEGQFVDPYTNQPLDLEDATLWNQDEPNNYRGAEDCLAVRYSDQRTGLEDQSCSASQSCVLCSLAKPPQLEVRGACPHQSLDLRYSLVLEQQFSGLYQLQGWADTRLQWNNNR